MVTWPKNGCAHEIRNKQEQRGLIEVSSDIQSLVHVSEMRWHDVNQLVMSVTSMGLVLLITIFICLCCLLILLSQRWVAVTTILLIMYVMPCWCEAEQFWVGVTYSGLLLLVWLNFHDSEYEPPICFQGLTSRYKCLIFFKVSGMDCSSHLYQKLKRSCLISLTDNK